MSLFISENLLSLEKFDSTIAFAAQRRILREGSTLMGAARVMRTIPTSQQVGTWSIVGFDK